MPSSIPTFASNSPYTATTALNRPSKASASPRIRFGNEDEKDTLSKTEETKEAVPSEHKASFGRKLWNGTKASFHGAINKYGLVDDAFWCGVVSLALLAIPGHQVFSVPIIFAIGAAFRGTFGFFGGLQHGGDYKTQTESLFLHRMLGFGKKKKAQAQ
jgi:hypothetical protein